MSVRIVGDFFKNPAEIVSEFQIEAVSDAPEIFADRALLRVWGGMARIILGRQVDALGTLQQCGLLLMPVRGFILSHSASAARLVAGLPPDIPH